jgi:glycosyltransferase involved in cell wall biosynthesis
VAAQLPLHAHRFKLQLIHDPTGISPFLVGRWSGRFKRVVTLHDATAFRYPETHTLITRMVVRRYVPMTLANVDAVITVSQSSKSELVHYLSLPPNKVHVVPNGVSDQFRPASPGQIVDVVGRYQLSTPFVLYVGALEPRKNIPTLLRAFASLRHEFPDLTLVVAGRERWKSGKITDVIDKLHLGSSVRRTDYVAAADLPALYSAATAFCFPSLAEGFGLPILEAMACGTPVVCSNLSSLPEVAGRAAVLVDPNSPDAVAGGLRRILSDAGFAMELTKRGMARAAEFSWELTAERMLAVYRRVLAD